MSDSKDVESDGTFSFKVFLQPGENKIKAQASLKENKSDFSDEEIISYINKPPALEINSPTDGQHFEKDQNILLIKGKTDTGVKITVNDFWAVVDEDYNFSYSLTLQSGDNNIKIIATDESEGKTERNLKVTYSP